MGLIQTMEEESECTEAIYQDYIGARSTHDVFLFFEGKDDYKYYWSHLSPFVGSRKYKKYVCQCKDNVISVFDMISNQSRRKNNESICCFVDRDFDKDIQLPDEIYVTPTYAIENLYVSDRAIENMLLGEWGLSSEMEEDDKRDFEMAINYLCDKRNEIIESLLYSNAWYSLQHNKSKGNPPYPKLSAIKEYSKVKGIRDKELLQSLVPNAVIVSEEEISGEMDYLREKPVERIRGKYFEQSMPYHFRIVFQNSNQKDGGEMFSKKRKVNINVGEDNMVSVLSAYADVPQDLIAYIAGRFGISWNT